MAYKFQNSRILVVDDMPPMQSLMRSLLNVFGCHDVQVVENGEKAFKTLCQYDPDLVLTDWIMEPMDGIELTKKIRTDPRSPNRFVPVILMTGFSSRMRVEKARDIGITEFLVKPFTAKDLYAKIEHIIEKPRQFVEATSFFGPDRRRRNDSDYEGPQRREIDYKKNNIASTPGQRKAQEDLLKKLKQDVKSI